MAGVSVSGTSTGGGNPGTATTNRQGNFSFRVASGTVTVTATKSGYTFQTQSIFVGAGETRSLGNIRVAGNMTPVGVGAARDADATTGMYDGMVTVTWSAGPGGAASEGYQVQTCVPNAGEDPPVTCNPDDTWTILVSNVANDADYTATESVPTDSENGFMVRVMATHDIPDDDPDAGEMTYTSDPVHVGAINVAPSNADADRDIDPDPDQVEVTWNGARAENTAARVIGSFDDGKTWVVLSTVSFTGTGYTAGADDEDPDHAFRFDFQSSSLLTGLAVVNPADGTPVLDTNDQPETDDLDATMMNSTFMIRVQARQPNVDVKVVDEDDVLTWKTSNSAGVDAKN